VDSAVVQRRAFVVDDAARDVEIVR